MEKYYTMWGVKVQYLSFRKIGDPLHYPASIVAVVAENDQAWRISTPFGIQDLPKSEWRISQEQEVAG